MATSTNNMDLVPKEVLDQLKELDTQLESTKQSMIELLKPVAEISNELQKSSTNYKTLTNLINRLNEAEDKVTSIEKERMKNMSKIQQLQSKLISLDSKEAKEVASLNEQLRRKNQENKESSRLANLNANSIEALRIKVAQLKKEWAKMDTGSPAFKKMSKEIDAYNKKLVSAERSIGVHGRNVGNYPQLEKIGGVLSGVAGKFIGVGTAVAALTGTVTSAVKKIADFEQANANLASVFGKTKEEIKGLTDSAKQLGATTEWMASDVTRLQTELAKLGFKEDQITNMQASILQFATAMGADLGEAAALAGASLRAFDMDSTETERALSVMAKGANNSALSFSYLQTSMSIVSPVAKTFGFNIEDTVTLLGSLANVGFDASSAATATRNILLNLADSNGKLAQSLGQPVKSLDDLVNGLKTLKSRGVDLATTLELTDKRSVSAFNAFLDGADSIKSLRKELSNTDGVLDKLQKDRLNTLSGSVKLLSSAWEGLMLSFSESSGFMKSVVDGLTNIISGITDLAKSTEESFSSQYKSVLDLHTEINPLITEYEQLKTKASLNADEQQRLKEVIESLSKTVPGAVTGWDNYGKAIDVSIDKVREYIEAEKARLKYLNRDLIEETKKNIESYKKQYETLNTLKSNQELYRSKSSRDSAYYESINRMGKEMKELQVKIAGAEEQLAQYTGRNLDKMLEQESEVARYRKEFNSMSKEELEKWIEDTKKGAEKVSLEIDSMYKPDDMELFFDEGSQGMEKLILKGKEAKHDYISLAEEIKKIRFPEMEQKGNGVAVYSDSVKKAKQKNAEDEMKAAEQLAAVRLKAESDANKAIVSDTKKTYEERMDALDKYTENLISSINKQKEAQINAIVRKTKTDLNLKDDEEAREASANQIMIIEAKASAEVEKIKRESAKTSIEIEKKRVNDVIKEINREFSSKNQDIDLGESEELKNLAKQYEAGKIGYEEYENEKYRIAKENSLKRLQLVKEEMDEQLKSLGITPDMSDEEIKTMYGEDTLAKVKDLKKKEADYLKEMNKKEVEDSERSVEETKKKIQKISEYVDQAIAVMGAMVEFAGAMTARKTKDLEKDSEENEEWAEEEKERIEKLEEAGAISKEQAEARKAVVDKQAESREEQIQQKKKELLKKQAIYERAQTLMSIIFNTAAAVMAAWKNPLAAPGLVPLIIASGAVQTATVLATPIPEYAEGTQDHPGGLAIVGDGGKSEMIISNGKVFKTPSTNTLVDLPEHSIVLPDFNAAMQKVPDIPDREDRIIDFSELSSVTKDTNQKIDSLLKMMQRKIKNDTYARELNNIRRIKR